MGITENRVVVLCMVLAVFTLAAIVACGGDSSPNTDQSPQEMLLSWLPADTTDFGFADNEKRPK